MMILIRPAQSDDAPHMCAMLNAIIAKGGTTALRTQYDTDRMIADYIHSSYGVSCFVADDAGEILGFQALEQGNPKYPVPSGWGIIATFVRIGEQGRGVGNLLFAATREAANKVGLVAIDATIRSENTGGLTYYSKMGFVNYTQNDTTVSKRYTLP